MKSQMQSGPYREKAIELPQLMESERALLLLIFLQRNLKMNRPQSAARRQGFCAG